MDGLLGGAAIAGRAAGSAEPMASVTLKASEARWCFKMLTPVFSHVPFIAKRQGSDQFPFVDWRSL